MTPRLAALLLFATAAGADAQPQKIYRCGSDGRQLQQAPCQDGKLTPTAPAPGTAERAAAAAVAKRDARLADSMEADRLERERAEAKNAAPAIGIGPAKPASAPALTKKKTKAKKQPA